MFNDLRTNRNYFQVMAMDTPVAATVGTAIGEKV